MEQSPPALSPHHSLLPGQNPSGSTWPSSFLCSHRQSPCLLLILQARMISPPGLTKVEEGCSSQVWTERPPVTRQRTSNSVGCIFSVENNSTLGFLSQFALTLTYL